MSDRAIESICLAVICVAWLLTAAWSKRWPFGDS